MHLLAEQTAEIACPVDLAYRVASNLERFGEWFPGVLAIESTDLLAHGVVGKQYAETVSIPMRGRRRVIITVKRAEPDRLLVTEGDLRPLLPRMEILFGSAGEGRCTVTWRMYSRSSSPLTRATMVPLARSVMRRRAMVGLSRLKKLLEAS